MSDDGMSRILAVLERLEQGQARLEGDVTRLRTDLMARMDRLQSKMDALATEKLAEPRAQAGSAGEPA